MQRLRWFLIGIAVTTFSADYVRMKAQWLGMEAVVTKAEVVTIKSQASNTECLVELAYNRALIESWEAKTKLITTAKLEALYTVDRAKEGDAEALATLRDMGYSISPPGRRLVQVRFGMGGP